MTKVRFTSWARIEPSASDPELRPGLTAEVADPAWFLARQWQLGELAGDDAASPALVEVRAEIGRPTRVRLGEATAIQPYDPADAPLDVLAEREPAPASTPIILAAEASLMLAEEVEVAGLSPAAQTALLADLRAAFPLPGVSTEDAASLAPATAELLAAAAGLAFDGVAAVRASAGQLPATATGSAWDEAVAVVRQWAARRLPSSSAWVPEQFGSRLDVGVAAPGGGVGYRAERVAGDALSWTSFDRTADALNAGSTLPPARVASLPATGLSFPGAPASRYWELEDAAIDLGAVGVAPSELARLVVLEYMLVYGNDMLVVPLDVPFGSRTVVTSVRVIDAFGDVTTVAPAAVASGGAFRLWQVTGDPEALFIPPVALATLDGPVVEDVIVARDEQSNLAWLIEVTGTDPAGGPVDLRRLAPAPQPASPLPPRAPDAERPPWRWRLAVPVPDGWHPLLPETSASGTRLVVGTVPAWGGPADPPARSVILAELRAAGLPVSMVPAEGIRLRRRAEAARWIDGSRHTWSARERRPGHGDAGSGVVFDLLERGD